DEQAAPRLEGPDVARLPHPLAPPFLAERLVPEEGLRVARQPVVGARETVRDVVAAQRVVVQNEGSGGLLRLLGVTRDAAALKAGFDVAVEFDVFDPLLEAQAGLVLDVPLLAGLVLWLGGQQGSLRDGIEDCVVRLRRRGVLEERGLLAVCVTAAAVV